MIINCDLLRFLYFLYQEICQNYDLGHFLSSEIGGQESKSDHKLDLSIAVQLQLLWTSSLPKGM